MKKQQQIKTSERGQFWLFMLPKSYLKLFESAYIYTHAFKIKAMDLQKLEVIYIISVRGREVSEENFW